MNEIAWFVNMDIELEDIESVALSLGYDAYLLEDSTGIQLNIHKEKDSTDWGYFFKMAREEAFACREEDEELFKTMTFKALIILEFRYSLRPYLVKLFTHLLQQYGGSLDLHGDLTRLYDLNNIDSLFDE